MFEVKNGLLLYPITINYDSQIPLEFERCCYLDVDGITIVRVVDVELLVEDAFIKLRHLFSDNVHASFIAVNDDRSEPRFIKIPKSMLNFVEEK